MLKLKKQINVNTNCHALRAIARDKASRRVCPDSLPRFAQGMTAESGRSMVEMLGVLAIVGVLSVMGIAGYTTAMRLAMLVSSQKLVNSTASANLSQSDLADGQYTFRLSDEGGTSTSFTLTATNVPEAVGKRIEGMSASGNPQVTVSGTTVTFTFNNDLGERSGAEEGTPQVNCAAIKWTGSMECGGLMSPTKPHPSDCQEQGCGYWHSMSSVMCGCANTKEEAESSSGSGNCEWYEAYNLWGC